MEAVEAVVAVEVIVAADTVELVEVEVNFDAAVAVADRPVAVADRPAGIVDRAVEAADTVVGENTWVEPAKRHKQQSQPDSDYTKDSHRLR